MEECGKVPVCVVMLTFPSIFENISELIKADHFKVVLQNFGMSTANMFHIQCEVSPVLQI